MSVSYRQGNKGRSAVGKAATVDYITVGRSSKSQLAAGGSSKSQLAVGRVVKVNWLQAGQ